jgi:lysophospholipase L1-like esterase
LTNTILWNGSLAGVFNFYGGLPTSDGVGCVKFPSSTVNNVYSPYVARVEVSTDAAKVQFKILDISGVAELNFIVNGRYVSGSVTTPGIGGFAYVTLDFTNAGGRAIRDIVMESQGADFCALSVGPTESMNKPAGTVLRLAVVGDSFTASGGMNPLFVGYVQILGDLLGIRDVWNLGVGGTGILTTGGQLTCPQRLSDLVAAAPNIILLACGHNDQSNSPTAVQAGMLAWLQAIRAQPVLANVPIIVAPLWGNSSPSTAQATETAMQAAVTAFNDPLVYFIRDANDPNGPKMTGTGCQASPSGTGNSDVYISAADCIHPYQANYGSQPEGGHWFYAQKLADQIMAQVLIP